MTWRRWLPLTGIAFVVVVVLAVLLSGSTPGTDDAASKVASFYNEHQNREVVASFLLAASAPFLVIFTCVAAQRWGGGEGGGARVWPLVFIGGSVLLGAIILVLATVHFALADGADNGVAPGGLQALNLLDNNFWVGANAALGVMMLGAAGTLLLMRLRGARWLGWIALLLGVLLFIPFADFFALLASLLWILVVSVMLTRGGEGGRPATARART